MKSPGNGTNSMEVLFPSTVVNSARQKIQNEPWAKDVWSRIKSDADKWAALSDEEICSRLSAEGISCADCYYNELNFWGCPVHGGDRATMVALHDRPGVWRCSLGGELWHNGCQVKHPVTGDAITVCEDTNGAWVAPDGFVRAGKEYRFTANGCKAVLLEVYVMGGYGRFPLPVALATAWLIDGNPRYLRACGLLLGIRLELAGIKLSEFLSEYLFYHDRQLFVMAYLMCRDELRKDDALARFFAERGRIPGLKASSDDLWDKFESAFFIPWKGINECEDAYHDSYFRLLFTSALMARGVSAPEMIEWNIAKAPGALRNTTVNGFFRDGRGGRVAICYNISDGLLWEQGALPELLLGYNEGKYAGNPLNLFESELLISRLRFCDAYCNGRMIPIGDTPSTRTYVEPKPKYFSADEIWRLRGAPGIRRFCAERLGMACDYDNEKLGELRKTAMGFDLLWILFHADKVDFSTVRRRKPQSVLFPDQGLAVLRSGANNATRIHLALNLMKNGGHQCRDQMALFLLGFGYDLTAMVGYAYFGGTDRMNPKCIQWETAALHRWGVVADMENMGLPESQDTGSLNHFLSAPGVEFVDGENPDCVTGPLFRRMALLVRVSEDEHYVVDMFRAYGGKSYDYSFHSLAGDNADNFSLEWDGGQDRRKPASGALGGGVTPMYQWLQKTGVAPGDHAFRAHWRVGDSQGAGVVMHVPAAEGRDVVTAKGENRGIVGESPWDPYLLLRENDLGRRWGSFFMTVVEPYRKKQFIKSVTALEMAEANDMYPGVDAKALAIETTGGTDIVVTALDREKGHEVHVAKETIRFKGNLGVIRQRAGKTVQLVLAGGTALETGAVKLRLVGIPRGAIAGLVPEQCAIDVTSAAPILEGNTLKGRIMLVRNPRYIAACTYFIDHVEKLDAGHYRIFLDTPRLEIYSGKVEDLFPEKGLITSIYPSVRQNNNQELNGKWLALKKQPDHYIRIGKMAHAEKAVVPGLNSQEDIKRYMKDRYGLEQFAPDNVGHVRRHHIWLDRHADAAEFQCGDEFVVYDIAPEDAFEIPAAASLERIAEDEWLLRATAPAEVEVGGKRFVIGPDKFKSWDQGTKLR